jgi:hypothetical protein
MQACHHSHQAHQETSHHYPAAVVLLPGSHRRAFLDHRAVCHQVSHLQVKQVRPVNPICQLSHPQACRRTLDRRPVAFQVDLKVARVRSRLLGST